MNAIVDVLREFVGWHPVSVTLDGVPVTDPSAVELVALPQSARPTDPVPDGLTDWKPGHLNEKQQLCVWLDAVPSSGTWKAYVRPTPVSPEAPVYELAGLIRRY